MNTSKYDSICRVCLNESTDMKSIFENTENNISNILRSLADVQVIENDGLPAQICSPCLQELKNACIFKIKCQQSDKLLRKNLPRNEFDVEVKDEDILHDSNLEVFFENCGSKTNDFFKTEMNYDATTHPTNFVKQETISRAPEHDSLADSGDQDNDNDNDIGEVAVRGRKKQRGDAKKKTNLQCSECDEIFHKKVDLKRHVSVDHIQNDDGEKTHKCIECSKMYSTEALLGIHMKTHSKTYICEQCDKKFRRLDIYVEHQKRHSNSRTHLCPKCGKGFFNQLYLERHIVTHNKDSVEKPIYECTICNKRLKHSNHLLVHVRSHKNRTGPLKIDNENRKTILCNICGKSCSSMSNLSVHLRRHSGKMTNFCKVCGKGFPRTTDLTIHMRQHTGEKPFSCNLCSRSFARSDKLVVHTRTHTGEKPYVCSTCGRAFAQSNDLASHKRRAVCSAPEPPKTTSSSVYTMNTNNVIQQPLVNETHAMAAFQQSAKFVATSAHPVSFISGK